MPPQQHVAQSRAPAVLHVVEPVDDIPAYLKTRPHGLMYLYFTSPTCPCGDRVHETSQDSAGKRLSAFPRKRQPGPGNADQARPRKEEGDEGSCDVMRCDASRLAIAGRCWLCAPKWCYCTKMPVLQPRPCIGAFDASHLALLMVAVAGGCCRVRRNEVQKARAAPHPFIVALGS